MKVHPFYSARMRVHVTSQPLWLPLLLVLLLWQCSARAVERNNTLTEPFPPPSTAPVLVSTSSQNGIEIGLCFDREMNPKGLTRPTNYTVLQNGIAQKISSVSEWLNHTSVVLRLSRGITGTFSVSAQNLQDSLGNAVSPDSVTGTVWGTQLARDTYGSPGLSSRVFSCRDGHITMQGEGGVYLISPSNFDYLREFRTNDFDVQLRIDDISKPTDPSSQGVDSPYLASVCLVVADARDNSIPVFELMVLARNDSRLWMLNSFITPPNITRVNEEGPVFSGSAENYPIWLRIRREGQLLHRFYSTNHIDWISSGNPITASYGSITRVGFLTISESSNIYATSELSEYGDTVISPGAEITVLQNPQDGTTQEHHTASFEAKAGVQHAEASDLIQQWQIESSPGSGVYVDIPLANSPHLTTPPLLLADSGRHFRYSARISGGNRVYSLPASITVSEDHAAPQVVSAVTRTGYSDVVVTFSEPILKTTATKLANYVASDFHMVRATLDSTSTKVSLVLDAPLDSSSPHSLTLSGIKDLAGNELESSPLHIAITAGTLLRGAAIQEIYQGLPGVSLAPLRNAPRFPELPDARIMVNRLESALNIGDNYGSRVIGYLIPPVSGNYNFWMCSDDNGEFWLSTDDTAENLTLICHEPEWNPFRNFTSSARRNGGAPENQSLSLFPDGIPLTAGQPYYFEAVFKEAEGDDHISVAWQMPGGQPPKSGSAPISGAYLALRSDPILSRIEIQKEPADTLALGFAANAAETDVLFDVDFATSDGGFTMAQSGNPDGAWTYDPDAGVWSAKGTDSIPISEKLLTSPSLIVGRDGAIQLTFTHRYSFEPGLYDGGQIEFSVNEGAFQTVYGHRFEENEYTGTIIGSFKSFMTPGFADRSEGYDNGDFVTSKANLGVFHAGDRIRVQFRGLWDFSGLDARNTAWAIQHVTLSQGESGFEDAVLSVRATVSRTDGVAVEPCYIWQRDCGKGYEDIPDANASTYRFTPSLLDLGCKYRCQLVTPGATATTREAKVEIVVPGLGFQPTPGGLTLRWSGAASLESSDTISGPWVKVDPATSPYQVKATSVKQFYRLSLN